MDTTKTKIVSYKFMPNGDELIMDENMRYHLFRNCEELTHNVSAIKAESFANDYWKYRQQLQCHYQTSFDRLFSWLLTPHFHLRSFGISQL